VITGVLNVAKPRGLTSHDVVVRVRRLSGERRIGHAGTLDPIATGVLLMCLGQATRIAEYLADAPKSYLAAIRLGAVTPTWDAETEPVETADVSGLTAEQINRVLTRFVGPIMQQPPMYSALKHDGQPLYKLARKGITVVQEPRLVEIGALKLVRWEPPYLVARIDCSKGTYVRSLAHDLGEALGVGAYLAELERTAVGPFHSTDAVPLTTLQEERQDGRWKEHLLPLYDALAHWPHAIVDDETRQRLCYGQAVAIDVPVDANLCFAYDSAHELIAVLRPGVRAGQWQPHKVFLATSPGAQTSVP